MIQITVFVVDPQAPSAAAARAIQHVSAAARRFGDQVEVRVLSLGDQAALDLGVSIEPTVLVDQLVVAVGQAPPAGHLVRAIDAALAATQGDVC